MNCVWISTNDDLRLVTLSGKNLAPQIPGLNLEYMETEKYLDVLARLIKAKELKKIIAGAEPVKKSNLCILYDAAATQESGAKLNVYASWYAGYAENGVKVFGDAFICGMKQQEGEIIVDEMLTVDAEAVIIASLSTRNIITAMVRLAWEKEYPRK